MVQRLSGQAEAAGCTLGLDAPASAEGRFDADRIEQVISNLLVSAFWHAPGSPVDVRVEATEGGARVVVADEGPGIAADERERVFERTFRGGARKAETPGLGLGLYISRAIAQAHGGTLTCESEPGRSARFVLDLPSSGAALPDPR